MVPPERVSTTCPDSNGSRRVCNARVENSGASSMNRMPQWAREIAPGWASPLPPPTSEGQEAV